MRIKFIVTSKVKKEKTDIHLKKVLFNAMLKMHELAVRNVPVNDGLLRNSIHLSPMIPGFDKYTLIAGKEYAADVEFGTKPHYVSPALLKDWARKKLGDENAAFAVSKKIQLVGTDAHPFFRPAFNQVKNIWLPRFVSQK